MKDIPAIRGRYYIQRLIEEGEHEHQDFKFAISDAYKIARSISAFANNDGGRLLIGVKDNGVVAGIRNEEDLYMIETAAEICCRPAVKVEMTAFKVDPGVVVIRAEIPKAVNPPVMVREQDGTMKAYYRVRDENIVAPEIMLRAWYHRANTEGPLMRLTEANDTLLALLREKKRVTLDEYVRCSHLPTESATDIVGRLVAASVVSLRYEEGVLWITL